MKTFPVISITYCLLFLISCMNHINHPEELTDKTVIISETVTENKPENNLITNGKKIFTENCSECHGSDGKKKLNGAKDLSISNLTLEKRKYIISSAQIIGNKIHQARWKTILSENEINEVATYLDSLKAI